MRQALRAVVLAVTQKYNLGAKHAVKTIEVGPPGVPPLDTPLDSACF